MRTTLRIDDDLVAAIAELARFRGETRSQVASGLLRIALTGCSSGDSSFESGVDQRPVAGFQPFPARSGVAVTSQTVNQLRDMDPMAG